MKRLIVFAPAVHTKSQKYEELLGRLRQEPGLAGSEWLAYEHGVSHYSMKPLLKVARDLNARVHERWEKAGGYDEVVLMGHSMGGLLLRQAYLLACGRYPETSQALPWGGRVSRILLLASVNRGVKPSNTWWIPPLVALTRVLGLYRRLSLSQLMYGSDFITQLRIQWIKHFSRLGERAPVVVQLLGTRDGMVRREDSVDLEQFPNAYHVDVPGANHANLYRLRQAEDPDGRYALYRRALLEEVPTQERKRHFEKKGPVVFVLHGIRASNAGWVEQVRSRIEERAPLAEVVTASYGYFSALNFVLPFLRRRNIGWFQDMYSYYLARYPEADFHFVGHSNGTYIFGQSLQRVAGMEFNRAVLAGSVLPREYDWRARFDAGQLRSLRNDRASEDFPVSILCSGLRGLRMPDIGTAGFDGFLHGDERLREVFFYKGGHSRALDEPNLDNIVDYVLTGEGAPPTGELIGEEQVSGRFRFLSRFAPYAVILLAFAAVALSVLLYLNRGDWLSFITPRDLIYVGIILFLLVALAKSF